jgi:TRAP-type C4-dicarboxylate transport system substrate-binding protein
MQFNRITLLGGALASAVAFSTSPFAAEDLPRTQLKVLGLQSHLNSYQTGEVPFWSERIPQESGGSITARLTAQDLMGLKGTEVLRLMKLGVLDFASGVLSYMASDNPQFEAIDLPGVSQTIETTREISDAYKPVLGQIMEEQYGVKLLMLFPSPPQVFWCQPEISGAEALPGLKVRVFNKSMADMVTAFGATSVTMPFGEVTPALERGVIDCAITGTLSGNTNKLFEVTEYLWPLYTGWSMHFHGASLEVWNGLDPAVQDFLLEQFAWFDQQLWDTVAEEVEDGVRCSIGEEPCKFGYPGEMQLVEVSDQAWERQKQILEETILPDWAQRCGKECAERWNETIGEVVDMSIDVGKL